MYYVPRVHWFEGEFGIGTISSNSHGYLIPPGVPYHHAVTVTEGTISPVIWNPQGYHINTLSP